MQSNDPLRPFKNGGWRYLNLMDQLLPDAIPCSSLVFTPSLTSPPILINMNTIDMLQTNSPTLVTDKQSSGMYVGSSTAGTSNSVDPKFEGLVKFGDELIDVGSHASDNHPPLSRSLSLSTNSSCISKCRRSALEVPSVSSFSIDPTGLSTSPNVSQLFSVSETSNKKLGSSHPQKHKAKPSTTMSHGTADDASQPVILQSIQSQIVQMNDLFECTSEDMDASAQTLAVENLQRLKTDLNLDAWAYFFDLFTSSPNIAKMYNQLAEASEDDHRAYIRQKLRGFNDN